MLLNPVPVMVTTVPTGPEEGVNEVMVGEDCQIKPGNEATPPGLVTVTFPVAPVPTDATMLVDELTVNEVADIAPKLTDMTPDKDVPLIVTIVPAVPDVGVNDKIVGKATYPVSEAEPAAVVTVMAPDCPEGTTALIVLSFTTTNEVAGTPSKLTLMTLVKLTPVIVTVAPATAEIGLKEVITGEGK